MPGKNRRAVRAWNRSLRFRLTAWYTGALAFVLLLAALLLYFGALHALLTETDSFLTIEARRLTVAAAGQPHDQPDPSDLAEAVNASAFSARQQTPHGMARSPSTLLLFDVMYLRLVGRPHRRALAISPDLARQPALVASLDALLDKNSTPASEQFSLAGPDEERMMRVLTEPLTIGSTPGWVQVAVPWDHNADVLERLGLLLAIGVPAILVVCAFGGWILVGRTLQPIHRIVTEAERLDADAMPKALLPDAAETDSEIGHLVATLNGMTTRLHRAFEAQRQFAEAQQRFAADASHELRTPLTILRGEMELALTRPRKTDAYRATLASAVEEIERMSRIVESLSFLARRDAGQIGAEQPRSAVSLTRLCATVTADFEKQARDKNITLENRAGDSAPEHAGHSQPLTVLGNSDQLQQLVGNLMDNALKYTLPGGCITLATRISTGSAGSAGAVVLTVSDTGIGIAPSDLPHLFERFWRADRARSAGGSGLGLAICAQIAQVHGGTLTGESESGRGSRFHLSLPLMS